MLKISPASDWSKHAQVTVWLPWEGFHDSNKIFYKELKNPKTNKNPTKQMKSLHRKKKNLHHILQIKSCREEASLFINLHYFNSESLFPKEEKGVGGCSFSVFS